MLLSLHGEIKIFILYAVFVLRQGYCNKNIGSELRYIKRYVT